MAATPDAILKLLSLKFPQAIGFFTAKLGVPTEKWDDLSSQFRDYAFTVAGVTSTRMLEDIQAAVTKQLTQPDGMSYRQFIKEFGAIAERSGWSPREGIAHRGLLVLQTNLRTAYSAGRNEQMNTPHIIDRRPYRIRKHRQCRRPRPLHLAWNNLILRHDDPFIAANPTPGGFGCGCSYYTLSEKEVKRRGGVSKTPEPGTKSYTDKQGRKHSISNGVDPGFENPPGMSSVGAAMGRVQRELIASLPEEYRSQVEKQSNLLPIN
jgi:uncharacterized protein with gpF-like domain